VECCVGTLRLRRWESQRSRQRDGCCNAAATRGLFPALGRRSADRHERAIGRHVQQTQYLRRAPSPRLRTPSMRRRIKPNNQNGSSAAFSHTTIFRLLRVRSTLGLNSRSNRSCSACTKISAACFSESMCGVSSAAGRSMARQSRKNDRNRTAFKAAVLLNKNFRHSTRKHPAPRYKPPARRADPTFWPMRHTACRNRRSGKPQFVEQPLLAARLDAHIPIKATLTSRTVIIALNILVRDECIDDLEDVFVRPRVDASGDHRKMATGEHLVHEQPGPCEIEHTVIGTLHVGRQLFRSR
jgi:hypothetical protein